MELWRVMFDSCAPSVLRSKLTFRPYSNNDDRDEYFSTGTNNQTPTRASLDDKIMDFKSVYCKKQKK